MNTNENQINTMVATSGEETAYPSGAPEFTPTILLSVLRYTDFDYTFGVFKLFLQWNIKHGRLCNENVSIPVSKRQKKPKEQ